MTASVPHVTTAVRSGSSSSYAVTIPATAAGAMLLLIVDGGNADGDVSSVSGGSGTWTKITSKSDSNAVTSAWRGVGIATGTTTITLSYSPSDAPLVAVYEITGMDGTVDAFATVASGSASSFSAGTATTTNANDVVVAAVMGWPATSATVGVTVSTSGYTNQATLDATAQAHSFMKSGYQIVSATGSFTYAGTFDRSCHYHAYVIALKQAGTAVRKTNARVSGAWVGVTVKARVGGAWVTGTPRKRVAGAWVPAP